MLRALWLVAVWLVSCTSAPDAETESYGGEGCPSPAVAYVFDGESSDAAGLLQEAGFEVRPLPLDSSPAYLKGLIWIGTDASAGPNYAPYMTAYAPDLYFFVDRANVLVQMPQRADDEARPPFLPSTHTATRVDREVASGTVVNPNNPLLAQANDFSAELGGGAGAVARSVFSSQGGFEVLLAAAERGAEPLLMEGAYGQGRLILSALPLDEAHAPLEGFASSFATQLLGHTNAVCNRRTSAIGVTTRGPDDVMLDDDAFTFAVLPDTQIYTLRLPGLFHTQTAWIVANARRLSIRYVFHLGDIVNNNTDIEWERAAESMSLLHGVVPYALVPGNHDYGPSGDASTRDTGLNNFFDYDATATLPSFGGAYVEGALDNTFHLFSAGGRDFIVVALEWGPRDEVIAWANAVMDDHPERWGILITHAYLNNNDRRYDHNDTAHPQNFNPHEYRTPGGVNDGEELWQKLVKHHRFVMTLNGHVLGDGTGYLASTTDLGHTCHQILSNYQFRELGGEAYLRLMELSQGGRHVRVRSYSPLYDRYLEDPDQQFEFDLDI